MFVNPNFDHILLNVRGYSDDTRMTFILEQLAWTLFQIENHKLFSLGQVAHAYLIRDEKKCVWLRHFNSIMLLRFSKTRELWNSKANWRLRFSLPSIILADLLENKTLLQRVQKVMYGICHWWISICFGCFCVSRFVACDRNYDWRQRKTQLWGRLLNFRVRMIVKSAVMQYKLYSRTKLIPEWKSFWYLIKSPWTWGADKSKL